MISVTVSAGQSLLDISLWLLGGTDALFALADANNLSITDPLAAGQVLVVPDGYTVDTELVDYYQKMSYRVNTQDIQPVVTATDAPDFDFSDWDFPDFNNQ